MAKRVKWAQLSKVERAYQKAMQVDQGGDYFRLTRREVAARGIQFKRERNRYYQLLAHWCSLKKVKDLEKIKDAESSQT